MELILCPVAKFETVAITGDDAADGRSINLVRRVSQEV
jgi:hypothetical protein